MNQRSEAFYQFRNSALIVLAGALIGAGAFWIEYNAPCAGWAQSPGPNRCATALP